MKWYNLRLLLNKRWVCQFVPPLLHLFLLNSLYTFYYKLFQSNQIFLYRSQHVSATGASAGRSACASIAQRLVARCARRFHAGNSPQVLGNDNLFHDQRSSGSQHWRQSLGTNTAWPTFNQRGLNVTILHNLASAKTDRQFWQKNPFSV